MISKNRINNKKVFLIIAIILTVPIIYYGALKPFFYKADDNLNIKMVSGTEYISGEYGQVIVRLSDIHGNPKKDVNCSATILYPDKTYFLTDLNLIASSTEGNYYAEFMTPSDTGIYEETIKCTILTKDGETNMTVSSSFHVSIALNYVKEMLDKEAAHYLEITRRLNNLSSDISYLNESVFGLNESIKGVYAIEDRLIGIETNIIVMNQTINDHFIKYYKDVTNATNIINTIFAS